MKHVTFGKTKTHSRHSHLVHQVLASKHSMQPLPLKLPSAPLPQPASTQGSHAGHAWQAGRLLPMTGLAFLASCRRSGLVTCHQRGPKTSEKPKITSTREKDMKEFRKEFMKKFGSDSLVDFSKSQASVPVFSTGALTLDLALGGGLPYGKLLEVYGPEQSGKTTLALSCCISVQKSGQHKRCAFIDVEHALDRTYAENMGLNVNQDVWWMTQPTSAEQALEQAVKFAEMNIFDLIVIDSVAQLVPQEEGDKSMGESTMGLRARLLSKFCRSLV